MKVQRLKLLSSMYHLNCKLGGVVTYLNIDFCITETLMLV